MDFNEKHYRYLPHNLKQLLEDPPTRYNIYPKDNSVRKSEELFFSNFDSAKLMEYLEEATNN
jgi:hypothetical protein